MLFILGAFEKDFLGQLFGEHMNFLNLRDWRSKVARCLTFAWVALHGPAEGWEWGVWTAPGSEDT